MRLLKRQLIIWFGVSLIGGAMLWNSSALKAQNSPPPTPLLPGFEVWNREQAAGLFIDFLDSYHTSEDVLSGENSTISAKSRRELGAQLDEVMLELAQQWRSKKQSIKTLSAKGKTTIMEVEVTPVSMRPLVLIEENGGWRVDVVETYAQWNKLENVSRATALAQLKANIGTPTGGDANRSVCIARLSQLARGLSMYAEDYDEKLPPTKEWQLGVRPYVVSERLFKCPSASAGTSFSFNTKLSAKEKPRSPKDSRIVLLYETSNLQKNIYSNVYRHQDGANFAFSDGHVQWFPKTKIPDLGLQP